MSDDCAVRKPIKQCLSCPWRIDCVPDRDIPNYVPTLHHKLENTIRSGLETMFERERHIMACHYSKPGEEFPCAGWLSNQIGAGNNIGVRLMVMTGQMPPPETDGPQHATFEETLCNSPTGGGTSKASSTSSGTASGTKSRSSAGADSGAPGRTKKTASNTRTRRRRA